MRAVILAICLLVASVAFARNRPLPEEQWNDVTHVWLARAMVAEAGWTAERDHVAIAYVLARRWRQLHRRFPSTTLVHVIRGYCAGLEPGRAELTPRQRWLRALSFDMREPDGWPRRYASWARHRALWRSVLDRAHDWAQGRLRDPCRGTSWHWGGDMDTPGVELYEVDCGATANTFYGIRRQGGKHGKSEAAATDSSRQGARQQIARR